MLYCHMSLGHVHAQQMVGWLSPYNAITTYIQHDQAIWQYGQEGLNTTVPLTHVIYENINYYKIFYTHMGYAWRLLPTTAWFESCCLTMVLYKYTL